MHAALIFILLLAVATACYTGFAYHLPAREARTAELTARYSDMQIFAARAGLTMEEALMFLKERGLTSVGVAEQTLWQLRKEPGSYVLSSLELAGELALNPALAPYRNFLETKAQAADLSFGDYLVFMPAGPWAEQVGAHLHNLYDLEDEDLFRLTTHHAGEMVLYLLQGVNYDHLPHLSIGAKPAQLAQVAAAGLLVNPYLSPRTVETPATAEQMLSVYEPYPLSAAVFEGGVVPGYPATLPALAHALQARNIPAVLYEYHRFPKGMPELAPLLDYNLVVMRDGSIDDDPQAAINGLRERRVQLLELELRGLASRNSGAELQAKTAARLTKLAAALQENGYTPGQAVPLRPFQGHFLFYVLMAAGIIALALFLLQSLLPQRPAVLSGLFVLGLAAAVLLLHTRFLWAQQALALSAAVLFPLYGALYLLTRPLTGGPTKVTANFLRARLLWRCLLQVFILFLFSLAGGLIVHGLLTTPPFFHGLEFFRGVKIMYILPLALSGLVALVLLTGRGGLSSRERCESKEKNKAHKQDQTAQASLQTYSCSSESNASDAPEKSSTPSFSKVGDTGIPLASSDQDSRCAKRTGFLSPAHGGFLFPLQIPPEQRQAFFTPLRRLLRRPLTWGDLLLAGLLLIGAYIYLTRTGHVRTIIPLEGSLRSTLEQIFGARPRFKEFALGYPLALIGLYLSAGLAKVTGKAMVTGKITEAGRTGKALPAKGSGGPGLASKKNAVRGSGSVGVTGSLTKKQAQAQNILTFSALFGGVLAPISVVNTFAHTLAPVGLSLLRSFHGFWLGLAIGLFLLYFGKKIAHLFLPR